MGKTEDGDRLELTTDDLQTHVHGVGASRTGKSKLIEWIAREMIRNREGFCLIDPHGFLYDDLVRWLAYLTPQRDVILFNPSSEERIVGFNPFRRGRGELSTQVDRRVRATLKAWGQTDADETPRLERWLKCIYHTLIEQGYSLDVALYLLSWQYKEVRQYLTRAVRSAPIRSEWEDLASLTKVTDFQAQIESSRNRLFRFIEPAQIRRVTGLGTNNLDLAEIIDQGKILLVSLQPSDSLTEENGRLLGTLLLNEIWEVGMRRRQSESGGAPRPFYLIVDEFQKFLTPDIPAMLDQAAKYGIHLFLFHQHLSQLRDLDERAYGAVMTNARTKIVFGGLSRDDARTMAGEIFPGQIDLKRVKFLIEQTKFWPVYSRDTVYTRSSGRGATTGFVAGETWNPSLEEWAPSTATSSTETTSEQEGEADIPIFIPVPFKEVSSITPYSLEETLWELSDRLMEQYQRHFMIRLPGKKTQAAVTPFVKSWYVNPERLKAYANQLLAKFLTAPQVDKELLAIHQRLFKAATGRELEADPAAMVQSWDVTQKALQDDERFSGPEPKTIPVLPPKRKRTRTKKS